MVKFWSKTAFFIFSSNWRETELIEGYLDTSSAKTWQRNLSLKFHLPRLILSPLLCLLQYPSRPLSLSLLSIFFNPRLLSFLLLLLLSFRPSPFSVIFISPSVCYITFACLRVGEKKKKNRLEACWHKKKTPHSPSVFLKQKKEKENLVYLFA